MSDAAVAAELDALETEAQEIRDRLAEPTDEEKLTALEAELAERRAAAEKAVEEKAARIAVLLEAQQDAQAEALDAVAEASNKIREASTPMRKLREAGGSAEPYYVKLAPPGLSSGTADASADPNWKRSNEGGKTSEQVTAAYEKREQHRATREAVLDLRARLSGGTW